MSLSNPGSIGLVPLFPLNEIYFRIASVDALSRYKSATLLSGVHAGRQGGRYNPPKSDPTLYLGGTGTLSTLEVEQSMLAAGVAMSSAPPPPRVLVSVQLSGVQVIDLTNAMNQHTLGIKHADLVAPGQVRTLLNNTGSLTATQLIGQTLRSARPDCEGLLVPSWLSGMLAQNFPRATNLVLFMDPKKVLQTRGAGIVSYVDDAAGTVANLDAAGH